MKKRIEYKFKGFLVHLTEVVTESRGRQDTTLVIGFLPEKTAIS